MPDEYLQSSSDVLNILLKLPNNVVDLDYDNMCLKANEWYQETIKFFKDAEKKQKITNNEFKRLREFYRGVLPQNNFTERVSIFNLRSFSNFYKLRSSQHAQPEIRKVAELMVREIVKNNICPVAITALARNMWNI